MMRRFAHAGLAAVWMAAACSAVSTQPASSITPYKLGTFAQADRTFLGLVLNDTVVVDLAPANAAFEKENAGAARVSIPADMRMLLASYEQGGVKARLAAIASAAAARRPAYAVDLKAVRTLPPVMPLNILNAAVNYTEHAQEMAGRGTNDPAPAAAAPEELPGIWPRKPGDTRHNPYVFVKPVGAVIGDGDSILLPPNRPQVDWECELAIVIGRTASRVPIDRAQDFIFGYTLENDVSDRNGRADRRHGSDWFVGKGHDTFAPLGPYIVPREFVPDPQKLAITFTLSGRVMQDSTTERMTHNVAEMVSFVSHILTLRPGDIISTGSPAGVGAARNVFMTAGDVAVCTIESIGTLTNPVMGMDATSPPAGR